MSFIRRWRASPGLRGLALGGGVLVGVWLIAVAQAQDEQGDEVPWEERPYTVIDGKVDFGTYNGYRRYDNNCLRCHGPDGAGSSYAPSLVNSLKRLNYEQFIETVIYGRENLSGTQPSIMPPFGEVTDVVDNLDDIYSYLKARADGEIGRGRPGRLAEEDDPVWQERRG